MTGKTTTLWTKNTLLVIFQNLIVVLSILREFYVGTNEVKVWVKRMWGCLFLLIFSLNCIFGKMQHGVEDQLIKLLIETQKHDPLKMFHFDIQTNVRKGVLLKYCSFIKFWEPPILLGRIHGAKLP